MNCLRMSFSEFLLLVRDPANSLLLDAALREQLEANQLHGSFCRNGYGTAVQGRLAKGRVRSGALNNHPAEIKRTNFLYRWVAAASVLLVLAGAVIWWTLADRGDQMAVVTPSDIAPGTSGAILTLADGTKLVLDSMGNGLVATQSGIKVELVDGRLTYLPTTSGEGAPAYNTMSTPKGRQFQLKLPDGTAVWLNAASSIQYPIAFTSKERRVIVTGEAYFEVVQDKQKPFIVAIRQSRRSGSAGHSFQYQRIHG